MRYRQETQVAELERYHASGNQGGGHDSQLYGSAWGDPYSEAFKPVREALEAALVGAHGVIEIGCGGGRWTRVISEMMEPSCKLTAVDGTSSAFALTSRWLDDNGLPVPDMFLLCPGGRLDLPAASVDIVFSFDTFVHFEWPLIFEYAKSVARVLKPGGKFLVNVACEFPLQTEWSRSDQWFEYALVSHREHLWMQRHGMGAMGSHFGAPSDVTLFPAGYGSAFLTLTRNERPLQD